MGKISCLTFEEAWKLAAACLLELGTLSKVANLCLANRYGQVLVQATMDLARPVTAHFAVLKARQAALSGQRTRWLRDKLATGEVTLGLFGISKEEFMPWAGGVPVYDTDGVLLGGMGMSNLDENEEEAFIIRLVESAGFLSARPA
jgi:uncharacterized protein GlcG (DUF336 family)